MFFFFFLITCPKKHIVILGPVQLRVLSCSVVSDSATLWTVACQAPLSMGILQATILEWVAMASSKESSQLRDQIYIYISIYLFKKVFHSIEVS